MQGEAADGSSPARAYRLSFVDQAAEPAAAANGPPTRVVVADRHPPMRAALTSALEQQAGIEVVASPGSWEDLLSALASHEIDVLLLDYTLVSGTLAASIRKLLQSDPELPIIVMAMSGADPLAPVAREAGARDFLLKDGPPGALVRSVQHAAASPGSTDVRATTRPSAVLSPHERSGERP